MKPHHTPLFVRLTQYKLLLILAALVVIAVITAVVLFKARHDKIGIVQSGRHDITPVEIGHIRQISQWEFLSLSDEELVDTVRRGIFSDDGLARIYYGTLRLGIDLKDLGDDRFTMDGDTVVLSLPPVKLLDSRFLDEARTRSLYEEGSWSEADKALMTRRAADKMRRRCLTKENYDKARQNAKEQLGNLLKAMGFEHSRVVVDSE